MSGPFACGELHRQLLEDRLVGHLVDDDLDVGVLRFESLGGSCVTSHCLHRVARDADLSRRLAPTASDKERQSAVFDRESVVMTGSSSVAVRTASCGCLSRLILVC